MSLDRETLAKEIGSLCQRSGALDPRLRLRLGRLPQLCRALEIDDLYVSTGDLCAALLAGVLRLTAGEPADVRRVLLGSLNLYPGIQHHNLGAREQWLAIELHTNVSKVTKMRRDAIHGLVLAAMNRQPRLQGSPHDLGYRVTECHATLWEDGGRSQSNQWRKLIATSDKLQVIYGQVRVPALPGGAPQDDALRFRITEGGRLIGLRRTPGNVIEYGVELPHPLQLGEVHGYGFEYRFAPGQPVDPRFVVLPRLPMEAVSETVHFQGSRPRAVWLINGVVPGELDSGEPTGVPLTIDESGQVHAAFHQVQQGLAYGIGWLM